MENNMIPALFSIIGCASTLIGVYIGKKFSERLRILAVATHELKNDLIYREIYVLLGSIFLFIGNYLPVERGLLRNAACIFFAIVALYQFKNLIFWLRLPIEALQKSRDARMKPDTQDK